MVNRYFFLFDIIVPNQKVNYNVGDLVEEKKMLLSVLDAEDYKKSQQKK